MPLIRKKYDTTAGNYFLTVPAGIKNISARGCGGGGGGASGYVGLTSNSFRSAGGAGGGGAPLGSVMLDVVPGEILTIALGAGGVGGSGSNNGNTGNDSTITGSVSGLLARFKTGGRGTLNTTGGGALPGGPHGTLETNQTPARAAPQEGGMSIGSSGYGVSASISERGSGSITTDNAGIFRQYAGNQGSTSGAKFGGSAGGGGGSGPFGSLGGSGGSGGNGNASGIGAVGSDGTVGVEGSGGGGGGGGGCGTTGSPLGGAGGNGGVGVVILEWVE